MKRVHGGAVVALERDMRAAHRLTAAQPEVEANRIREVREHALLLVDDPVAEQAQNRLVETLRPIPVAHVDRDVRDRHSGA